MREYLALLPEYLARCAQRLDLFTGILAGVVFFVIAWVSGLGGRVTVPITVGIILFAALEAGYSVYREERAMRAEREAKVRLIASPSSIKWDLPDRHRATIVKLDVHVHWEIWTDIDINTAQICLNIIGFRGTKRWRWCGIFWQREKRLIGLPPKGQDTFYYRKSFRSTDLQPIEDDAEFEYEGPIDVHWGGRFALELVLVTGSPSGTYRAYLDPRLWERGSREPL
jgi:hypothetical protein